jgi:hypothetical protein
MCQMCQMHQMRRKIHIDTYALPSTFLHVPLTKRICYFVSKQPPTRTPKHKEMMSGPLIGRLGQVGRVIQLNKLKVSRRKISGDTSAWRSRDGTITSSFISHPARAQPCCSQQDHTQGPIYSKTFPLSSTSCSSSFSRSFTSKSNFSLMAPTTASRHFSTATAASHTNPPPGFAFAFEYVLVAPLLLVWGNNI